MCRQGKEFRAAVKMEGGDGIAVTCGEQHMSGAGAVAAVSMRRRAAFTGEAVVGGCKTISISASRNGKTSIRIDPACVVRSLAGKRRELWLHSQSPAATP